MIQDAWVTSTLKEAKETAWLVAYWAAAFAGNVACTASPTRNTLKSQRKFSCPAVWIRQPKELRMKRLLGLLLLIHSRTATTVPSPKV